MPLDDEGPAEDARVDRVMADIAEGTEGPGEPTDQFSDDERAFIDETQAADSGRISGYDITELRPSGVRLIDEVGRREPSDVAENAGLEQVRALVAEAEILRNRESRLTLEDIKSVFPPETVRGLEPWQREKVRFRVRRILRDRYERRMSEAMDRRGDISGLSDEETGERLERYSKDVADIDEEYGYVDLADQVAEYFRNPE